MFRASPRPSSGASNCTSSLWFYRWRAATGALLVVVCQTTTSNAPTVKPEVPRAVYAPDDGRGDDQNCETVASCWLNYLNRMMMHKLANVKNML